MILPARGATSSASEHSFIPSIAVLPALKGLRLSVGLPVSNGFEKGLLKIPKYNCAQTYVN